MPDRVRLTVPSEARSLALVEVVTRQFGDGLGVPAAESESLASQVGELVRFTLEHAYPGDTDGHIQLTLDLVGRRIQVDVHDWGRPLTSAGGDIGTLPPELQAIAEGADDLRLINLGADGKRLILTTTLSQIVDSEPEAHDFDGPVHRPDADGVDVREELEIRDAGPDDAEAISQLLYENYHLTYGHPDFYRPRWVSERLESGALLSTVAVHGDQVIGHHAVMPEHGATSAETGVAVVHSAYRGLGIFNRVFDHTLARAETAGLDAVWGRAVTVHPYSQRAESSHGYRDTALMLGSVPAKMTMEGVDAGGPGTRTASLLAYRILRHSERAVSLPTRHAGLLRATYDNVGLATTDPGRVAELAGEAVEIGEDATRSTGSITMRRPDASAFAKALRHLLARHHDVIYADLDLQRGVATDDTVQQLGEVGFFYAGLVLHGRYGHDYLRLQRMNAENIEVAQIVCDSKFSQAVLAAVLEDRRRVDG